MTGEKLAESLTTNGTPKERVIDCIEEAMEHVMSRVHSLEHLDDVESMLGAGRENLFVVQKQRKMYLLYYAM